MVGGPKSREERNVIISDIYALDESATAKAREANLLDSNDLLATIKAKAEHAKFLGPDVHVTFFDGQSS